MNQQNNNLPTATQAQNPNIYYSDDSSSNAHLYNNNNNAPFPYQLQQLLPSLPFPNYISQTQTVVSFAPPPPPPQYQFQYQQQQSGDFYVGPDVVGPPFQYQQQQQQSGDFYNVGLASAYGIAPGPNNITGATLPTTANPFHIKTNGEYPPKQTKIAQPMWCEVCKIACDTKDVLDIHITGKKHKKNLDKLGAPSNTNSFSRNTGHEDAQKKMKIVQFMWCEVCKIPCNTKDMLEMHKSGKKHKTNLKKLGNSTNSSPAPAVIPHPPIAPLPMPISNSSSHPPVTPIAPSCLPLQISTSSSCPPLTPIGPSYLPLQISTSSSCPPLTPIGPSYLPVPISNPSSIDKPFIGPLENPVKNLSHNAEKTKKNKAAALEDLESKRIKVLNGGAAADAVRTCVYCNVVCNSETVYTYHIAGKKHATMVNKFAVSGGGASVV